MLRRVNLENFQNCLIIIIFVDHNFHRVIIAIFVVATDKVVEEVKRGMAMQDRAMLCSCLRNGRQGGGNPVEPRVGWQMAIQLNRVEPNEILKVGADQGGHK